MLYGLKGIIFDIEGVLEFQGRVYPGAIETIRVLREKGLVLRFLTNGTLHSRQSRAEKLQKAGFYVLPEEIVTASYATACYLEELKSHSCWVMLEQDGLNEFANFHQDQESPEYIVVGDNRSQFDFEHLNKAFRLLLQGAKLIGMSPELVDSSLGQPELNVGSWVKMLEIASGVRAVYIGKPNPYAFALTLESMGLDKDQVIMVGDRIESDVRGATEFGIKSALVKTGEFKDNDLEGGLQPCWILNSIADLLDLI